MAETLLSFGVERLWNLLVRESERSRGFDEKFKVLKRDVRKLTCFLEDADAKKHTSATVRNAIMEIKEIVYDAEDVIETFLLKEGLSNTSGIRNTVRRFSCISLERRGLGLDVEALSTRITKEIQDMQSFGVVENVISNDEHTQSLKKKQREMRETFPRDVEEHLVGLEKNVEKLVGYLMKEDNIQVVSITGMGGIGKTTLARQVFNHETIQSHFPGLAWVCVSQQFTRKYVWQTILQQLKPEMKVFEMTDYVLQENLSEVLETQKALIVIDDIWRERDWDRIKHVFLQKKGWKILLTSRNEGVGLHADPKCITFKPECLTFEDSWDLFQRIAFPMKYTVDICLEFKIDEEMEEMGKQMIKCCGGLPLALKVLGGLLADHNLHEWERIYENIKALIVKTSRFETCQLHDMMREVCLRKAEEENFVQIIIQGTSPANSKSPCKSRRLVVHKLGETFNVETEVTNASLRSLLFIKCGEWKAATLFLTRHKLMRVLDLSYVEFEGGKVPSSIGKLIHLRYLSVVEAYVTRLPSSMRNLKQLLYLNISVKYICDLYMPNILKEMRELTYLWLPKRLHNDVKMELGNLVKLETLENFSTKHGSVSDLEGMTHLRTLSIHIRDQKCTMETLSSSLSKITHLENLTVNNEKSFALLNDGEEGFVLNCVHLRNLALIIYMPRLPDAQRFPCRLTTIDLTECRLKEDPMPILEKLSQLKEVKLKARSFSGRRMVCSTGGFPQLQVMWLDILHELEEWIVEEGSMPLLRDLLIADCGKLKELPDGLRFIPSLKSMEFFGMGKEWKRRLSEGGEDYHKVQYIRSVKFF